METKGDLSLQTSSTISGAATLIHSIIKENELLRDQAVTILTQPTLAAIDDSLHARRCVIAAIAQDDEKLQTVLERCLKLFGDSFYVKHTPILQQEALAQTIVTTCSYIQRTQPMFLTMMAKSSYHVSGMSNRIGASSPRARFLGMAVGSAISKMVDKPELQLNFDLEGDEAMEAEWYQQLTHVDDKFGELKSLDMKRGDEASMSNTDSRNENRTVRSNKTNKPPNKPIITEIKGPRIVEILDESEEEDKDLVAYAKPDSDPEDDTDDPTEINRNKPSAPVYIRDLIAGLRDHEDFDRHQLALSTAASLIRRKANFGTEVTDHLEELASILTGLSDNFDLPEFNSQRQQALIAVLLAKPGPMAQWFARVFFSGDYSLQQRIAILTTLGLGARELAGLKDDSSEGLIPATPSFPSKELPPHLHNIYAEDSDAVAKITGNLARQILSPIAADAADRLSGPDVLKVRKFSSRMEVEQRRSKPIPNALAQVVADNFFFPLTGRWWISTRASSISDNLYTSAHILPPFLHTLALLLNASGANTLALPQMTREFWELLLSVRTFAANDKEVLRALLFAFLMLLETNNNKERLATDQAKELLETQQWVQLVFNSLGAGSEEDERVRVLAAGVIVRCQEVVDKYQRRMVGSMMDF
jgi:telomere length regulation protein